MGDADVEMADAPAAGGDESKGAEAAVEMVLPMVDESLLGDIKSMGFDETIARKALMGGSSNAEQAVNWILSHENDAGIALAFEGSGAIPTFPWDLNRRTA